MVRIAVVGVLLFGSDDLTGGCQLVTAGAHDFHVLHELTKLHLTSNMAIYGLKM